MSSYLLSSHKEYKQKGCYTDINSQRSHSILADNPKIKIKYTETTEKREKGLLPLEVTSFL